MRILDPTYKPSPQPNRISGLNGAIPTQWDAGWQFYTDLTPDQVAAFQAMPEWQDFLRSFNAWVNPAGLNVSSEAAPSLTQDFIQSLGGAILPLGGLST